MARESGEDVGVGNPRILIVSEQDRWFVRRVANVTQDDVKGEMVYRCDQHLGGPFMLLQTAVDCARAFETNAE